MSQRTRRRLTRRAAGSPEALRRALESSAAGSRWLYHMLMFTLVAASVAGPAASLVFREDRSTVLIVSAVFAVFALLVGWLYRRRLAMKVEVLSEVADRIDMSDSARVTIARRLDVLRNTITKSGPPAP